MWISKSSFIPSFDNTTPPLDTEIKHLQYSSSNVAFIGAQEMQDQWIIIARA